MLGETNSKSMEGELEKVISISVRIMLRHLQGKFSTRRESFPQEVRNIGNRNEEMRPHSTLESMVLLSGLMNLSLSQKMESLMNVMQTQINIFTISAINDNAIIKIQSIVVSLPFWTDTSTCRQDLGSQPDGSQTILTKQDSRCAQKRYISGLTIVIITKCGKPEFHIFPCMIPIQPNVIISILFHNSC